MLNSKIRPRAVVGYGVKIFHPSPPNCVTRSPGSIFCSRPSQKRSGSIAHLTSQSTLHDVYKEVKQCKSDSDVKSGIDPLPF